MEPLTRRGAPGTDLEGELERRMEMWRAVRRGADGGRVPTALTADLRVHRGQRGIYRDLGATGHLAPSGVTVGVLHKGTTYADDLSDAALLYHYPSTERPGTDRAEVEATKACGELGLPLFAVLPGGGGREVRIGWVTRADDALGQVLVEFSEGPLAREGPVSDGAPFELRGPRARRVTSGLARANGQARFRIDVFSRYGPSCAFCGIADPDLLQAAHLCPVEAGGTDDPRNGLVLCYTHHRAFDLGKVRVDPEGARVLPGASGVLDDLGVTRPSLSHLRALPHPDALRWAWARAPSGPAGPPAGPAAGSGTQGELW